MDWCTYLLLLVAIYGPVVTVTGRKTATEHVSLKYSLTACEGESLDITCPSHYNIQITDALYGRDDEVTCSGNKPEAEISEKCQDAGAYTAIKTECDKQNNCTIPVTTDFFGVDPCVENTYKYARVTYRCKREERPSVVRCLIQEDKKITCPNNQILAVTDAQAQTDHISGSGCENNGSCLAQDVTMQIKQICDLKTTCMISPEKVDDICERKEKKILIKYTCSECENTGADDKYCETLKAQGECEKNSHWMIPTCRRACWECSEPVCINNYPDEKCERWANNGRCVQERKWMHTHCRKSCFRCQGVDTPLTDQDLGIRLIGQDIAPWEDYPYVTQGQKKVFLVGHTFHDRGMLFAFLAYIRNLNPVVLQAWRPISGASFKLIFQKRFVPVPENIGGRTVIYLNKTECGMVGRGDQLAFMLENSTGTIGYNFAQEGVTARFYTYNDTAPRMYEVTEFDQLGLPFSFGLAAVYDTNLTWYAMNEYSCNKPGLEVPPAPTSTTVPVTTTTGPVYVFGPQGLTGDTGVPGKIGATGPRGETGKPGPEGAQGPKGPDGQDGKQGQPGAQGSSGVKGQPGPVGAIGAKGPTGDKGFDGEMGDIGEEGSVGLPGPPGEPGMPGRDGVVHIVEPSTENDRCKCHHTFHNNWLVLAIIIWITLLTWILIILATVAICQYRKNVKEEPEVAPLSRSPWVREMKTEEYLEYRHSTINRDGTVSRIAKTRYANLD